jgi:hypothetical protein
MSVPIKLLLLNKGETLGYGLRAIREYADRMIDVSDWELGISDSTMSSAKQYVIKDNVMYMCMKSFFDLDNNERIFVCVENTEPYDVLPEEETVTTAVPNPDNNPVVAVDTSEKTLSATLTELEESDEPTILVMPDESIDEEVTVKTSTTFAGSNAEKAQNRNQSI